jgi:hypothetical protein
MYLQQQQQQQCSIADVAAIAGHACQAGKAGLPGLWLAVSAQLPCWGSHLCGIVGRRAAGKEVLPASEQCTGQCFVLARLIGKQVVSCCCCCPAVIGSLALGGLAGFVRHKQQVILLLQELLSCLLGCCQCCCLAVGGARPFNAPSGP